MRLAIRLIAAVSLSLALASAAQAQKIDANGKCHDAQGKFAKMEVCKALAAPAASRCRDIKTKKFAKCSAPNTEPAPAKK